MKPNLRMRREIVHRERPEPVVKAERIRFDERAVHCPAVGLHPLDHPERRSAPASRAGAMIDPWADDLAEKPATKAGSKPSSNPKGSSGKGRSH